MSNLASRAPAPETVALQFRGVHAISELLQEILYFLGIDQPRNYLELL